MANYTVIIRTSLDAKGLKSGEREAKSIFDNIAKQAEAASKREVDAQKQANAAMQSLQRQRSAALIAQLKAEEAEAKRAAQSGLRAVHQAEREKLASFERRVRQVDRMEQASVRQREAAIKAQTRAVEQAQRAQVRAAEQGERDKLRAFERRIQQIDRQEQASNRQREAAIRNQQRAFEAGERAKQRAAEHSAERQAAAAQRATGLIVGAYNAMKVAVVAVFAAIAAGGAGLTILIQKAVALDTLERSLKVVAGSAEEAARQLARLKELARLPGLGFQQAVDASIKLQIGFQNAIKDTTARVALAEETIKQFSNAVALTGGGPEVFERVITQITQMSSAGKVLMTDLRPIITQAPAIGLALQNAFGTISPEEINKLGLSTEEFMRKLNSELEKLARAPNSAANAWTNFTNTLELALATAGKPFLEPLTHALTALEPLLANAGDRLSAFFTMIGEDSIKLWANLPAETKAAFADMLSTVESLGGQIVQWFRDNYPLMQEVVTNVLNQIAAFWQAHGEQIRTGWQATLKTILEIARTGLLLLKGDWEEAGKSLVTSLSAQGPRLQAVIKFLVSTITSEILTGIPTIRKAAIGIGVGIAEGVWEGIKNSNTANRVKVWAAEIVIAAKNAWAIRSPSRVFYDIGMQAMEGLQLGIETGSAAVERAMILTLGRVRKVAESLTRERRVPFDLGSGSWFLPEMEASRERRLTPEATRERIVDPIAFGWAKAQEDAIREALEAQEQALQKARDKIAGWAGQVSDIFGRAVFDWDGKFQSFFKSIGRGFLDMFKNIFANLVQNTIFKGVQNLLTRILLPGTAGGASGGGVTGGGGGGLFSGLANALSGSLGGGGGISIPGASSIGGLFGGGLGGSLSIGGALGGAKGAATGAAGGFGLAGLGGALAPLAPLLGLSLGASAGGSSGLGSILGGAGGLIGGLGLAAALSPGFALGLGGALSGVGLGGLGTFFSATSGLALLGPIAAVAAPLIIGAIILGKNAARRRDERTRDALSHETGTAIWALIEQAPNLTLAQARAEWNAIEQRYRQGTSQLRDSKTRRHAELQWQNDFAPLWQKVEARVSEGTAARTFSSSFVPTFSQGGFHVPGAANGLFQFPGAFDKRDDMMIRVSRGEPFAVMTPNQFQRMGGAPAFQAAGVPALANGGMSGPSTPPEIRISELSISIDAAGMVKTVMKSAEGRKITVDSVRVHVDKEGSEGLAGDIENKIFRRK